MHPSFFNRALILNAVFAFLATGFPLDDPYLVQCASEEEGISATVLQTCVDQCLANGHSCGNRLNGGCDSTSTMRLSCAHGCEIAYYTPTVDKCKASCNYGNKQECYYKHPNIDTPFSMCAECGDVSDQSPTEIQACSDGCDFAATNSEFYTYVKKPRFLFAGQSNMEGVSNQALPGSFRKLIVLINKKNTPKNIIKNKLRKHLNKATEALDLTSKNAARFLYGMKKHLRKRVMFNHHPNTTCSSTHPPSKKLDCERPLSSDACGHSPGHYGPELMFGHVFPKLKSPLQRQAIGIAKYATGGTELYAHWMKENKADSLNHWYGLVDTIKGAKGSLEAFVWFQGETDSFADWNRENYLDNLTKFIIDVRQEIFDSSTNKFALPTDIPVIIVELGGWAYSINSTVVEAQRAFVEKDKNAAIVKTGASDEDKDKLIKFYHYDAATQLIIGNRIAEAMAQILRDNEESRKAR